MLSLKKRFLFCVFASFVSTFSFAQQVSITGKIEDKENKLPVKNAVVMILSEKDSILQSFTRTNAEGNYTLNNVPLGNKIVMISNALFAEYVDNINVDANTKEIASIGLTNKSKLLGEIIIKTGGSIKIKGDTTVYTADSFNVSANANVEELLKKLPGIQVDRNGDIKAMGEKVQKVLVDGEEFFGDDPGMAVKNLRADAVKEVQVFDKKSDQATFTGIDDGNTQKTINLKLKEDKKKGYFGKVALSGGTAQNVDNRFNNNFMYGSFKGKRKLSAFVLNGNTGQDGLSWQEQQRYGGNDDGSFEMYDEDGIYSFSFSTNSGSDDEININTQNGFLRNVNSGLQYSNKWNNKHNLNFSPKYNQQDYTNLSSSKNITQLGDSILNEQSNISTNLNRYNFKNTLIYDANIDSANSIKLTVRGNYYHSKSEVKTTALTVGKFGTLKNNSIRNSINETDKNSTSANIVFKHKFRKPQRTLSINADLNHLQSNGENYLSSENNSYEFGDTLNVVIDQFTSNKKSTNKLSSKINYTEPLSKKWAMELAYELSTNTAINNQNTYTESLGGIGYDAPVDSLTNDFKQNIVIQTPSAKFNYNFKKIKFNFGAGFGITDFNLLDRTSNTTYKRNFINPFPNANFVYTYKGNHALRIKYRGYMTQPTINQLQPIANNTNLFNQFVGNPDLKPTFTNNITVTHNGYNFLKELWNYQNLSFSQSINAITYDKGIDANSGKTVSRPINTNGNISANLWAGFGYKIKKANLYVQGSANISYSKFSDVINNFISQSNTTSAGLSVESNKSKADKYEFSLRNEFNINYNTNGQTNLKNTFKTNTLALNGKVYYKKVWSISTEYEFFARQKLVQQTDNLNVHFLNAQLQRTFKKNEYTVYFKVRDLLNQNQGVDRNYYGNTFSEERNQRLQRYFMIGFTWDFKNKATKK